VTGDVTGNASTATALQNVRTLWGQNFDGTANVSGSLTGVTDITAAGTITGVTDITASGTITATTFVGSVATAATAVKLSSARTFALTGDVTGTTSSDLDTGFSISTSIPAGTITDTMVSATAAIAYSKLALSNSIVDADISATAAIAYSKLAALPSANIIVGSATDVPTAVAVTGDVTISNAGVTAISAGVIVDADINAAAAIADTKLDTISTAGKVSNSATTATASNTADTIVLRDASGDFSAGTITADVAYDNSVSGLTATDVQDAIDELQSAKAVVSYYTITVETTDWVVGSGTFYEAVLTVSGLLSADRPLVSLDLSAVAILDVIDVAAAFQTVYRVEASDDDELTLYASSVPSEDFDLLIQVVR
jgi:hypothetical protein